MKTLKAVNYLGNSFLLLLGLVSISIDNAKALSPRVPYAVALKGCKDLFNEKLDLTGDSYLSPISYSLNLKRRSQKSMTCRFRLNWLPNAKALVSYPGSTGSPWHGTNSNGDLNITARIPKTKAGWKLSFVVYPVIPIDPTMSVKRYSADLPLPTPKDAACGDLFNKIREEEDHIRSCVTDSDCGKPIVNGCSPYLSIYARSNADTTTFANLYQQATQQCQAGLVTVCNYYAIDKLICDQGRCGVQYTEYPLVY